MSSRLSPRNRYPVRLTSRNQQRGWGISRPWSIFLVLVFLGLGMISGYQMRVSSSALLDTFASWLTGQDTPAGGWDQGSLIPASGDDAAMNILILGGDARLGEGEAARTDAIMALAIRPLEKKAVLISIPRDLFVSIPGYGEGRINTAYFYGVLNGYHGGGAALAEETVGSLLGMEFDHYVHIDFQSFVRLVDLMGGVDIDVPQDIWDPLFPDENYGYDPFYLPAGQQYMDGETLLKYVRTRFAGDDFDRVQRQQQAMRALAERALSLDIIPRLPDLMGTIQEMLDTDLEPWEIISLGAAGKDIGIDGLELVVIDETMTTQYITPDGAEVLLPDYGKIRGFVAAVLSEGQLAAGGG